MKYDQKALKQFFFLNYLTKHHRYRKGERAQFVALPVTIFWNFSASNSWKSAKPVDSRTPVLVYGINVLYYWYTVIFGFLGSCYSCNQMHHFAVFVLTLCSSPYVVCGTLFRASAQKNVWTKSDRSYWGQLVNARASIDYANVCQNYFPSQANIYPRLPLLYQWREWSSHPVVQACPVQSMHNVCLIK